MNVRNPPHAVQPRLFLLSMPAEPRGTQSIRVSSDTQQEFCVTPYTHVACGSRAVTIVNPQKEANSGKDLLSQMREADTGQLKASIQVSVWPVVVSRHMMSPTPLWSKSPTPTATEPAGCAPISTLPAHWPFLISQMSMSLVVGLYQTMSLVPSRL